MTTNTRAHATRRFWLTASACAIAALAYVGPTTEAPAAPAKTSPKMAFGHNIGDDYFLPNYTQTAGYVAKLAKETDRVKIEVIGKTIEGRDMELYIVSAPENLAKLDRYKEISSKLARAEGLTDDEARALAAEGKAVVWIDAAIHSTEVPGTDQMAETIWQMASRDDAEMQRFLKDVIVLFAHCNPDGHEKVADWYMRRKDPKTRVKEVLPAFDKKWIGQESNRDFFMMNMPESTALNRQLYLEWIPQITYNHHGAAYPGAVVAAPPFRDPFNYVYDPMVVTGLDAVAAAMNNRWAMKDMPGATQRTGIPYSTWWNGGIRNTGYFHNMLGVLTEIMGHPTPVEKVVVPYRLQPKGELPYPIEPGGLWHYRQSIDYLVEANYSLIDYASRNREALLYNIYQMGKNSIQRGSEDFWTPYPKRQEVMLTAYTNDLKAQGKGPPGSARGGRSNPLQALNASAVPLSYFTAVMKDPTLRDPRGFIISADQPDFAAGVAFVNALIKAGILVQKASAPFTVNGKSYPAGSYVVKTDQAFRPHVIDMFEPQNYPNDFIYPGGPPIPPYDSAGWTLAYEMGFQFDRVLDGFTGPFQRIPYGEVQAIPAGAAIASGAAGWVLSPQQNNAFMTVNELLTAGVEVYRLEAGSDAKSGAAAAFGPGAFYVAPNPAAAPIIQKGVAQLGLAVAGVATKPTGPSVKLTMPRVAVWDKYGGTTPGGWTRWLLGQYGFGDHSIYSQEIDAGNLRKKYDVIVFGSDAIPRPGRPDPVDNGSAHAGGVPMAKDMPAQYRGWLGQITAGKSIPALKKFVEEGGTIIAMGTSSTLAMHFGLPVTNMMVETVDGKTSELPSDRYFVPGSLLRVSIDKSLPVAWGMPDQADVFFDSGAKQADYSTPVFKLEASAKAAGVKPIAWFADAAPLRSGWAWGQDYLKDGVAAIEAPIGKGMFYAFSPQIVFRGQTYGTYKLFFNTLYGAETSPE